METGVSGEGSAAPEQGHPRKGAGRVAWFPWVVVAGGALAGGGGGGRPPPPPRAGGGGGGGGRRGARGRVNWGGAGGRGAV